MKTVLVASILALVAATGVAGPQSRTLTGVISDSMCGRDHAAMKVSPDSKCVTECVKASESIHFTLLAQKEAYILGDRKKPARFAGQKVKVKGVLAARTNVIQVESIEPVR